MGAWLNRQWGRLAWLLGTGLGVGLVPVAPGTFGSLWGPPMMWGVQHSGLPLPGIILFAITMAVIGVPICGRAAREMGREDPGSVVFDEIAAFPLVFLPVIAEGIPIGPVAGVIGFAWFRLFDISKPWPIRRLEHFHGGLGIMLDDLLAGAYAGFCTWATLRGWQLMS